MMRPGTRGCQKPTSFATNCPAVAEELRRRYDELNAEYANTHDSYDEFIKGGAARSRYARKGGAYNFQGQQDRPLTPLVEFLRWQEWYVQYCKLRNIGQHAYK